MAKKILFIGLLLVLGCDKTANSNPGVLVKVNEEVITLKEFEREFESLPPQYKEIFMNDKVGVLDELIKKKLLVQEAERHGIKKSDETETIQELLRSVIDTIEVGEDELKEFYKQHKSEMQGRTLGEVRPMLEPFLLQQKQQDAITKFIDDLQDRATITKNDKWIKEQTALTKSPLDEAFESVKVTVVDFGASNCLPCIQMKPIFADLEKEYEGKANILLLEISDHRSLARKYQITLIPTQIFFDVQGNEVYRHIGFMSKEEIVNILKEMGVK